MGVTGLVSKELIYISIPRTGTNSIHSVIGQTPDENHQSIKKIDRKGFSFAFVRNPFDLAVSWFEYHKKYQKRHKQYDCSFIQWVDRECPHHWTEGFCKYKGVTHPIRQMDYITNEQGRPIVNFIGRYERLQDHFNEVMKLTGRESKQLPRLNRSDNLYYWGNYYTQNTKNKFIKLFQQDFEFIKI